MSTKLDNFNWGWMDEETKGSVNGIPLGEYHRNSMISEIFDNKIYEKIWEVKKGDIVLDIGASVGPFSYSILDKKPKHIYCLEPSNNEFQTLQTNLDKFNNITLIKKGISYIDDITNSNMLFGGENEFTGIKFSTFIKNNNLDYIDFIKTDCEGAEYYIFIDENIDYLLNNVGCIVGEWHLGNEKEKVEFRYFRDKYLSQFKNVQIMSVDGVNCTWDLYNEHFLEYYNQVMIYISNKY